jgi:hypothetical protein
MFGCWENGWKGNKNLVVLSIAFVSQKGNYAKPNVTVHDASNLLPFSQMFSANKHTHNTTQHNTRLRW